MNVMIVPSVSAGSSHRAARETCTPQVMTPSGAAWSGRAHASRRNAIATSARRARPPLGWRACVTWLAKAVQALFLLGDSLEVPFDDLARMRPGRHGVGVVGRPHDVLDPDELPAGHPHPVLDESRKDLTSEVLARGQLQRSRVQVAILVLRLIELLQEEGQPAHLVFRRHEFQTRKSLEDTGEDQDDECPLYFVAQDGRAKVAV